MKCQILKSKFEALFIGVLLVGMTAACSSTPKKKEITPRQRAVLLTKMAEASRLEKDYPGAFESLNQAKASDRTYATIYLVEALTYLSRKDTDKALEAVKEAYQLDPKDSSINNAYGKILFDLGKTKQARKYLKFAANDPTFRGAHMAWTNLGMLEYKLGRFKVARSKFKNAVRNNPRRACVAHYYLGKLDMRSRKYDTAINGLKQAVRRNCGGFGNAHLALAYAYAKSGKMKRARKKYLEITEMFPNTPVAKRAMRRLSKLP